MACAEGPARPPCPGAVLLVALMATATSACSRPAPRAEIPARLAALEPLNVVLVVVDTLRADWTTPYGFERDTSPELARWAARGALFEQVRAQSSWTKMSVASLMTSLWPRSHGIHEPNDGLAEGATTLAEVLHDAGYATYGVQTNGWLHQSFGFHQGFDRYMFPRGGGSSRLEQPMIWPHADRVYEEAVRLIDAHERGRPFFLYLHFMDVHEYASPPSFKVFGTDSRGAYLAAIRWVDDTLERVRDLLEWRGLLDQTIIVLDADHGETFGEHGIYGHARNVLTPVVWVPLVIRFPFPIERVRVACQVRNVDLAPTILEMLGLAIPESFEGRSLLSLVSGAETESDRVAYARLGFPLFPDSSVQSALHDGNWTYAKNADAPDGEPDSYAARAVAPGAEFLFDRRLDPGENVDLTDLEPEQAARMRSELAKHLATAPAAEVRATNVRIDPGIAERLRAMGYLQDEPREPSE